MINFGQRLESQNLLLERNAQLRERVEALRGHDLTPTASVTPPPDYANFDHQDPYADMPPLEKLCDFCRKEDATDDLAYKQMNTYVHATLKGDGTLHVRVLYADFIGLMNQYILGDVFVCKPCGYVELYKKITISIHNQAKNGVKYLNWSEAKAILDRDWTSSSHFGD
jgi:hypothetical protein